MTEMLPLEQIMQGNPASLFDRIIETMPLVHTRYSNDPVPSTHFAFVTPLSSCRGLGRYVTEICCRWTLPGQVLPVTNTTGGNFAFVNFPKTIFYFLEVTVEAPGEKTIKNIAQNSPAVAKEIRTNLMAVEQTRNIIKIPDLSFDERAELLKENLDQVIEEFPTEICTGAHKLLQEKNYP